jgi:hypothetical protein
MQGVVVIKMGDHTAIAMKGFSPYNMSMDTSEGVSFGDLCKAQGFYPGMGTVVDVLRNSVYETACKSEDPSDAAEKVSKMFDEAKQYAVGLIKALPAKAFKLEAIEVEVPGEEPAKPADKTTVEKTEAEKAAEALAAEAAKTSVEKTQAEKDAEAEAAKPVVKNEMPDVAKLLADGLAGVTAQLTTEFGKLLAPVQKSVDGLNGAVEGLTTKVAEVEGVAKAAEKAVKGTVLGSDAGEDATTSVQKGDGGYKGREIDTGYAPRRRAAR